MAEIVDLELDDVPAAAPVPSKEDLKARVEAHLASRDLTTLSLKGLRRELEQLLGLISGSLDGRKDEIKTLAQQFAQVRVSAQSTTGPAIAPPGVTPEAVRSPPKTEAPVGKRRRTSVLAPPVAAAAALDPAQKVPRAAVAAAASKGSVVVAAVPPPVSGKRKNGPSAYVLWSNDNRTRIVQELTATKGEKPGFGEVAKALSEGWKSASAADKATYEQRAAQAKEEAKLAKTTEAAHAPNDVKKTAQPRKTKEPAPANTKVGKARKEPPKDLPGITRADFLRAGQALSCSLFVGDDSAEQKDRRLPLTNFVLRPRIFKSGGTGWFQASEAEVSIGGETIKVRAQLNVLVPSSKHWADGEGLADLIAAGASLPDTAEDTNGEAIRSGGSEKPREESAGGAVRDGEHVDPVAPSANAAPDEAEAVVASAHDTADGVSGQTSEASADASDIPTAS